MTAIAIQRAIYGKLAGDTTLNNLLHAPPAGKTHSIYPEQAPDAAQYPFVVYSLQAGSRIYGLGSRALDSELWWIRGIARAGDNASSSADEVAASIADRLDALLTDGTLSIAGGSTASYWRFESPQRYSEESEGQPRLVHAGGMFRLIYN